MNGHSRTRTRHSSRSCGQWCSSMAVLTTALRGVIALSSSTGRRLWPGRCINAPERALAAVWGEVVR